MQSWQLPEHIADILPERARYLESTKEQILNLFRVYGYELVHPPLMEYSNSLLTHIDNGLSLKTIRIPDQISGQQLGIRADITPQVARIDAHLLSANKGINRLCYSGSVLHAKPDGFLTTREPFQTGAELYGFTGIAADIEVIDLMIHTLSLGHISNTILSLGHIGIFRALAQAACLDAEQSSILLSMIQEKDSSGVQNTVKNWHLYGIWAKALSILPELYGGRDTIERARHTLPQLNIINKALNDLEQVCQAFPNHNIHIDLAEVRVDNYHTGLLYAAYSPDHHDAIARGGRYDGLGEYFGRARPATGFSFDLRIFTGYLPDTSNEAAVLVTQQDYTAAREKINELRAQGIRVMIDYGQPANGSNNAKYLINENGEWTTR